MSHKLLNLWPQIYYLMISASIHVVLGLCLVLQSIQGKFFGNIKVKIHFCANILYFQAPAPIDYIY